MWIEHVGADSFSFLAGVLSFPFECVAQLLIVPVLPREFVLCGGDSFLPDSIVAVPVSQFWHYHFSVFLQLHFQSLLLMCRFAMNRLKVVMNH